MQTKRFGTFEGVFTPCLLSILGVIMYLRLGWVVGSVGITGALIIICLANLISIFTALSMASVVTNIRIGTGGAYSIISKSLGIEAGGAIGIPLYLSQALSVAFYITGFTECWIFVFPGHPALLVSLTVWLVLLIVSYLSAKLAFRIQFVIMAIIGLSLVSIALGQDGVPVNPPIISSFPIENFWSVFAIFFPAVTGLLAGAAMSGELIDPKVNIPRGTFAAVFVSFGIYIVLAIWFAFHVPAGDLVSNTSVVIEVGRWRWLVIAGIMGATLSSALGMSVSSPRTLLALGKHSIVPFSSSWARINKRGEPAAAVLFSSLLILITILYGTLDQVANLLTMFFLITYGIINLSVFIEQTIGITSFRPTFQVSRIVPFLGALGCGIVMFLINIQFTLIAIAVIVVTYIVLLRREVEVYSPDVRSGLLLFMAENFARLASKLPYHPKIWKPNLLIPVNTLNQFSDLIPFIHSVIYPSGRIIICHITSEESVRDHSQKEELDKKLLLAVKPLKEEGIFVRTSVAQASDFIKGSITIMQAYKGLYFPSNTLFYNLTDDEQNDSKLHQLVTEAEEEGLGVMILYHHSKVGFSQEKIVNLWIRRKSPNIDLSILVALQLEKNWEGTVRIIQVVQYEQEKQDAFEYLERMRTLMRLPLDAELEVLVGEFQKALNEAPPADINIFGMPEEPDFPMIRTTLQTVKTSVLFLRDSKHESAVA